MIEYITQISQLQPYVRMAEEEAKLSQCTRRQFGSVIMPLLQDTPYHIVRANRRVSNCCNGGCARDRATLRSMERVEIGAEVHAETAAIIDYKPRKSGPSLMVHVGFSGARELLGTEAWPCATCAKNIKYIGLKYVYMKNLDGVLSPVSVAEILEFREAEWEPND